MAFVVPVVNCPLTSPGSNPIPLAHLEFTEILFTVDCFLVTGPLGFVVFDFTSVDSSCYIGIGYPAV